MGIREKRVWERKKYHMENYCLLTQFKNIKELEGGFPVWLDNSPPRSNKGLSKNLSARCGLPPKELLVREISEAHPQNNRLAFLFGFPPKLDDKTLFLHTTVLR